jgi:hypothetical protein
MLTRLFLAFMHPSLGGTKAKTTDIIPHHKLRTPDPMTNHTKTHCPRSIILICCAFCSLYLHPQAFAEIPEFEIQDNAVHLEHVGPDNPILYDNDWWFDVFDNNYLWAQVHLGNARLVGNVVSRDMWDWQKGYLYSMDQCMKDAQKALDLARKSGLRNIPDITPGSDRVLERPESGKISDTQPHPTPGSRLMVQEARKASPEKPLLIISGGPLTTVANALLTDPGIAPNIVVFNLTVAGGYNGKDGWSAWIVANKARLVDWATGSFWDKNSVFTPADFEKLPANPFFDDMRRLIHSDLGQANQLGDGAPLVWLWRHDCWRGVGFRKAVWGGRFLQLEKTDNREQADVLEIPKAKTDLKACRAEFFRILNLLEQTGE